MSVVKDYTQYCGQRFDALTVLGVMPREVDAKGKMKPARFKVRCDCGNVYDTSANDVIAGRIHSCKKHRGKTYNPADHYRKRSAPEPWKPYDATTSGAAIVERLHAKWYCKRPTEGCVWSATCHICCCECDKKHCDLRCANNPAQCGGAERRKKR